MIGLWRRQRSFGWERESLLIVVLWRRVGSEVCGGIGCVLPSSRSSQRGAERSHQWFDNEAVLANEDRIGDSRELQQHGAELGVEASDVDASDHPRRPPILEPNVHSVAVLLAPCLEIRRP